MDAAAILLGDQPGLTSPLIDQVLTAARDCEEPIVRPVYGEAREPGHPVIIRREFFSELSGLKGDAGVRQLLADHTDQLHELPMPGPAPRDIDTPEDYQAIRQTIGRSD